MSTKSIPATKLRYNLGEALNSLKKDDILIITRRGKDEKAIVDIDLLEDLLAENNPEFVASIKNSREQIRQGEAYSFEEIFPKL